MPPRNESKPPSQKHRPRRTDQMASPSNETPKNPNISHPLQPCTRHEDIRAFRPPPQLDSAQPRHATIAGNRRPLPDRHDIAGPGDFHLRLSGPLLRFPLRPGSSGGDGDGGEGRGRVRALRTPGRRASRGPVGERGAVREPRKEVAPGSRRGEGGKGGSVRGSRSSGNRRTDRGLSPGVH
jgi:hypothetical protein